MTDYTVPSSIDPSIFRAYDIRGIAFETLTPNAVYAIGLAIGSEIRESGEHTIVLGYDGRLSSPALFAALQHGLQEIGVNSINIGLVPTPALYFALYHLKVASGVMLTGSHNPGNYNGLKILLNHQALSQTAIQHLHTRIKARKFSDCRLLETPQQLIDKTTHHVIIPDYIARIKHDIQLARPLTIVIDSGNGVAGAVAPQLFRALGCRVVDLFSEVDGHFPHHHPDPADPANLVSLIERVAREKADIGLAFDGDGDRLGVVTDQGTIIWPDRQLMLFAHDVLSRNPGATVVFDVKCSSSLPKVIQAAGGKPILWKTGHSFIKKKMQACGAVLAGEMSGHIFFSERWYGFDDALYAGARLLEILSKQHQSSDALFASFPNQLSTPELQLHVQEHDKQPIMDALLQQPFVQQGILTDIDGLRLDFDTGWGLVRPSNTTPCLVFRFEADNQAALDAIQACFRSALHAVDPGLHLPF